MTTPRPSRRRAAPWIALALATAAAGCSRSAPCAKLADAICARGTAARCVAFVDAEMVAGGEQLPTQQKQDACQLVLDDPPTVAALRRAFEERQAESE